MKVSDKRLHYMDSLRSVAMFLGLVLHAAVFFAYWPIDPRAPHPDTSLSLHYLKECIHTFRMELFFLVAGFFSSMLSCSRGILGFLKNRLLRIMIPFVCCVLVLEPWIAGEYFLQQQVSPGSFWDQYLEFAFNPSYLFEQPRPVGNWFWHFWFLHFLIYFALGFVFLQWIRTLFGIRSNFFEPFLKCVKGPFGILFLTVLIYPVLLLSPPWADVPGVGTSLDVLMYYGTFFIVGSILFLDESVFDGFKNQVRWHVLPFVFALIGFFYLVDELRTQAPLELLLQNYSLFVTLDTEVATMGAAPWLTHDLNWTGFSAPWEWHLMCLLRGYTTWCGIVFFIVLFRSAFQNPNPLARYASDASYFVYLIHFPIQFSLSEMLIGVIPSSIFGFWACLLMSTSICLVLYHFCCRNTWLGVLLNGRRYPLELSGIWDSMRVMMRSRITICILVFLIGGSLMIDWFGARNERQLLNHALMAENHALLEVAEGKDLKSLLSIQRPDGRNALHMASHHMPLRRSDTAIRETVSSLIGMGFDPDSQDSIGQTPLHYAIRFGNMIALDLLLDAGANPNAQELRFGQTPMHMAAVLGNEPLLEKLIQAGGRWELTRRDGSSGRDLLRRFHPNSTMLNHE